MALKQHKCIILQFWRLEIWNGSHWAKIHVSAGPYSLARGSREGSLPLPFPDFKGRPHSLARSFSFQLLSQKDWAKSSACSHLSVFSSSAIAHEDSCDDTRQSRGPGCWPHLKVSWWAPLTLPLPHNLTYSSLQILGCRHLCWGDEGMVLAPKNAVASVLYSKQVLVPVQNKRVASWGCQCSPLARDLIRLLCTHLQSCWTPVHDGSPEILCSAALQIPCVHGAARNCGRYMPPISTPQCSTVPSDVTHRTQILRAKCQEF